MKLLRLSQALVGIAVCLSTFFSTAQLRSQTVIYEDALGDGWLNYSWDSNIDFGNTSPTASGSNSISVDTTAGYGALYLFNETAVGVSNSDEIRLQLRGSVDDQVVSVFSVDADVTFNFTGQVTLQSNSWTEVVLHVNEIGSPTGISGIAIQEASGNENGSPVFFVDQIEIGDFVPESVTDALPGPSIIIDVDDQRGAISDGIYGLNFAEQDFAAEIGLAVNRWGGNSTTRYNWTIDTTNLASDFYYENMFQAIGQTSDEFVTRNVASQTDSMVTIGMLGYVAKSQDLVGSYSVAKYGAQTDVNMYRPDHGNGILLNGDRVQNDPLDTGLPVDEDFATEWVEHFVSTFGTAANGGVRYYMLDNEPMLWNSTHVDAHPDPVGYDDAVELGIRYAEAIKAADSTAEVMGPAVFGWTAYFYSALDAAPGGDWFFNPLDRLAHDNKPFLQWYLEQFAAYEANSGTRLLDYLDIHYYPQGDQVALEPAGDADRQARRLESTRTLWDPDYVDNSWINDKVRLIPRMKEWIADYYPGTKLAINEYNFGGLEHINGAVTQADVLGIFGREGLDIACMWAPPASDQPGAFAFRMYRNYDGEASGGSRFGDVSLLASSADASQVSVFAADRTDDGAHTVVLINKTAEPRETPLTIANLGDAIAEVYTYDDRRLDRIIRYGDLPIFDGEATIILPPNSITTMEISQSASIADQPGVAELVVDDDSGQRSRIDTLSVRFDGLVSFVEDDPTFAFTLEHVEQGAVNLVVDEVDESEGVTVVRFSFEGPLTRAGNALIDGDYRLSLNGLSYFDQSNRVAGMPYVSGENDAALHALYGDSNGDNRVDIRDLLAFRRAFLTNESDPDFAPEFDYDDNGSIDILDLLPFRKNYGSGGSGIRARAGASGSKRN